MGRDKKQVCEEGAPGWIVTFSDLMSLLLTFFVLLLSFSSISEEKFNRAVLSLQGALGVLPANPSMIGRSSNKRKNREESESEKQARELRRQLQIMGKEQEVKIEFDAKGGLKISLPNAILFETGSATLKPEASPVLGEISRVLAALPDTFVEVKGHTDTTPLTQMPQFRDNYQLSYFRAEAVMQQLVIAGGVPEEQFQITAAGQNQPMATNTTPEGRATNRRVEIFVRGLIDKSTIESLRGEMETLGGPEVPMLLPISPAELEPMR